MRRLAHWSYLHRRLVLAGWFGVLVLTFFVFATSHAQITRPAVRTAVAAPLAKVARLPGLTGVTSPYTAAGAKQLSQDGHVAFATVNFRKDANKVSAAEANKFVK